MHDPYFNDQDPQMQGTVDMVMYIVPILKAEGFSFVRVDKVPDIAAQLPPLEPQAVDAGATPVDPGTPSVAPSDPPCN